MSNDERSPYRDDHSLAYQRIAQLESELASLRRSVSPPGARALAALHVRHLGEDQAALVARFRGVRRALTLATGGGMVGAFALALSRAMAHPGAAVATWLACGGIVIAVATVGAITQTALFALAQGRHRTLARRVEEERVAAGFDPVAHNAPGPPVRVLADPFEIAPLEPEAQLAESTARAVLR